MRRESACSGRNVCSRKGSTAATFSSEATGVDVHAPLTFVQGTGYADRSAAPFALLDTILTSLEFICRAEPNVTLPAAGAGT